MRPLNQKKALVLCDFDGTTCTEDVGSAMLNHFAANGWEEIDREYLSGKTGSRSAYLRIAPFLSGDAETISRFARYVGKVAKGFKAFYHLCEKKGIDVKIVSDGFDLYIDAILTRRGLAGIEFFSNALAFDQNGRISLSFPKENYLCGRCGTCKSNILNSYRLRYEKIIYVGDGQSDLCPSRHADVVFARDVLLEQCGQEGRPCIPFQDFYIIRQYVKKNF